jgi:hypothetical protein
MDEWDAFERQIAFVSQRVVGPPRSVDAWAVVQTARAVAPRRLGRLRSVTSLVASFTIVMLVIAVVVIGSLIQPGFDRLPGVVRSPEASVTADPTPRRTHDPDLLAGATLVTEEIEPGVYRVVSDGVRDLARATGFRSYDVFDSIVSAGHDGSVWVFTKDHFFRLGDLADHTWDGATFGRSDPPSISPHGRVWQFEADFDRGTDGALRSFDGTVWKTELEGATGFHMWPDGTIWATDVNGRLLRRDGTTPTDTWEEMGSALPLRGVYGTVWVSPRIDPGLAESYGRSAGSVEVLTWHRATDQGQLDVSFIGQGRDSGDAGAFDAQIRQVDMSDAGDWWIFQDFEVPHAGTGATGTGDDVTRRVDYLVHVDDLSKRVLTGAEGVPSLGEPEGNGVLEAAPDGSVWMTVGTEGGSCDGIATFDGETWHHFLRGACVVDIELAPDGTVWLQAGLTDDQLDIVVIRPDVAMADA